MNPLPREALDDTDHCKDPLDELAEEFNDCEKSKYVNACCVLLL